MKVKIAYDTLKLSTQKILEDLNSLLFQLDPKIPKLLDEDIFEILKSNNSRIFIARNDAGRVIGMVTLIVFNALSGKRATLEDVIVDKNYRGQGIGKELVRLALSFARKENITYVDLTSRPSRAEANNLYISLKFQKRDTNVYRYIFK